jgi:hypothetical protein
MFLLPTMTAEYIVWWTVLDRSAGRIERVNGDVYSAFAGGLYRDKYRYSTETIQTLTSHVSPCFYNLL